MSTPELVLTTGNLSAEQREQVLALWQRNGVTIPQPETRLSEVRGFAIDEGRIVGVATAGLVTDSLTKQQFLTLRSMTDEAFRGQHVAILLVYQVGQALHKASIEGRQGPEIGAILQYENTAIINDHDPMRADAVNHPNDLIHNFMAGGSRIGYDATGALCNILYYQNAKITPPRPDLAQSSILSHPVINYVSADYDVVVRMNNLAEDERNTLFRFWDESKLFPSEVAMMARLPYVRAMIFHDSKLVGSASVMPEPFPAMRTQIHGIRVFIDPTHSDGDLHARVVKALFDTHNQAWINREQPGQPAGMTDRVDASEITDGETHAVHAANGFCCAGFDDGSNMCRLHWFQGANLGHVKAALGS